MEIKKIFSILFVLTLLAIPNVLASHTDESGDNDWENTDFSDPAYFVDSVGNNVNFILHKITGYPEEDLRFPRMLYMVVLPFAVIFAIWYGIIREFKIFERTPNLYKWFALVFTLVGMSVGWLPRFIYWSLATLSVYGTIGIVVLAFGMLTLFHWVHGRKITNPVSSLLGARKARKDVSNVDNSILQTERAEAQLDLQSRQVDEQIAERINTMRQLQARLNDTNFSTEGIVAIRQKINDLQHQLDRLVEDFDKPGANKTKIMDEQLEIQNQIKQEEAALQQKEQTERQVFAQRMEAVKHEIEELQHKKETLKHNKERLASDRQRLQEDKKVYERQLAAKEAEYKKQQKESQENAKRFISGTFRSQSTA